MKIINAIITIFSLIVYIFFSIDFYWASYTQQVEIMGILITIDVTIIGFLMTLIGVIAAIRNIEIVDSYFNENGKKFKNIYGLTLLLGTTSIFQCLLLLTNFSDAKYDIVLLILIAFHFFFILSCMFNIYNIFEMVFVENKKHSDEKENIYK
ncbi:hypothetical protein AB6G37_10160 [Staphylococcus ureilyticus]|uniref:hypothetical protein n=1 Tax=Staphylococcus TaxID=1279 RepID=UPI000852AFC3|nr:hypothetical protein [Staphylococcus saprophyticus]MDW3787506.1 hypothetical protein [Staphylococcus saprophyticus]MDW3984789.1 hypothetical protein [Staphylococcus saprophyticus]MDW4016352.1 hypothetical protein [Staphylococcus saprophyticus]MDW4109235.1 hypothetical protein [Staphylococcus saprophyticus]MDW4131838.1 hypothetical protein [Staphylococcus saprophyticus]